MVETFTTRTCRSCWQSATHSALTDTAGRLTPATECTACGWVSVP